MSQQTQTLEKIKELLRKIEDLIKECKQSLKGETP